MDIDTAKGTISYKIGSRDLGTAFFDDTLKSSSVVPFVGLKIENDRVEITAPTPEP